MSEEGGGWRGREVSLTHFNSFLLQGAKHAHHGTNFVSPSCLSLFLFYVNGFHEKV